MIYFKDNLIIEKYRYGLFKVFTDYMSNVQVETIVNVWRDSDGKFHCQEADTCMGGFSGNAEPNKVSQQIVESKEFQDYIIEQVRKDYSLSENVEDYYDKYDDETYEFFEANPQLAIYQLNA